MSLLPPQLGSHQGISPPDDLGVLQPGVLHYLISRDTLLQVDLEELGDQVLGRAGDGVKELRIELVVGRGDLNPEVETKLPILAVRASSSSSRHLL